MNNEFCVRCDCRIEGLLDVNRDFCKKQADGAIGMFSGAAELCGVAPYDGNVHCEGVEKSDEIHDCKKAEKSPIAAGTAVLFLHWSLTQALPSWYDISCT